MVCSGAGYIVGMKQSRRGVPQYRLYNDQKYACTLCWLGRVSWLVWQSALDSVFSTHKISVFVSVCLNHPDWLDKRMKAVMGGGAGMRDPGAMW